MQPKLRDRRLYWRGSVIWCRVVGPRGRIERQSTKCRTEEAAVAAANELERAAVDPTYAAASRTTLDGALSALLADLDRRKRSDATKSKARQKVGHFVRLWGSSLPLVHVTSKLVLEYIDRRQREGVADLTIKDELGHLGQALKLARHVGAFHETIDRVLPPFFSGKHKPRERWPTAEEMGRLREHVTTARMAHLMFFLATGARLGEAARARRGDVDWSRRVVHLRGTKTAAANAEVPITSISEPMLRWALEHAPGKDRLFNPWGKLHRDVAAACVRAGIAKLTPNDFRRGFGKWHRLAGVDVTNVSKMLRHTTDKLAQTTYAKVTGEEVGQLVATQIRALPTVPNLYAETTETAPVGTNPPTNAAGYSAPPGELESPANALGKRDQSPVANARSVGNRLAWQRRRAADVGSSVRVLYPSLARAVAEYQASEWVPVAQARAALTDLALREGIAVAP